MTVPTTRKNVTDMDDEQFHQTRLSNGIRVISEYIDSVYSVALGIWVITGSQDETRETNGIAHLLEHMAFKGTINRSAYQIATEIESIGGAINAFTGKNVTCYFARFMSAHLRIGVDVLADLIKNPVFDKDDLEREKGVIIEEIREIEDSPGEIIHDYFTEQLFPDHPIGWSIQGSIENIRALTVEQLFEFIHKHYTSDRLVVAASGRVDHQELVDLVNEYLGDLPGGNGQSDQTPLRPVAERTRRIHRPISQSHLILGRRVFPQSDSRRYPLALLNVILSGGMSSRLYQNIREQFGFVYAIYSFYDLYLNNGLFGVYAGVDTDQLNTIRDMIYTELNKLARTGVDEAELRKVKQQFEGGLVISLEGMQARMNRLAKMEIFENRLMTIQELLDIINKITVDNLMELAIYLAEPDQYIETVIVPETLKRSEKRS